MSGAADGFALSAKTAGPAPAPVPGSLRRTSTIDSRWLGDLDEPVAIEGRARDLLTPSPPDEGRVLDEQWLRLRLTPHREILSIEASGHAERLQALIGARVASGFRAKVTELLPDEAAASTCLYHLLDEVVGACIVFNWVWHRHRADAEAARRAAGTLPSGNAAVMQGVCSGFRAGSSGLDDAGISRFEVQSAVLADATIHDGPGWHVIPEQKGIAMRRARWIEVVGRDADLSVTTGFQDSSTDPSGSRAIVHEYLVRAIIGRSDGALLRLDVDPRVLPYRECTPAATSAKRLEGRGVGEFRTGVAAALPGTLGCTHLNDVLRTLSYAPKLLTLGIH